MRALIKLLFVLVLLSPLALAVLGWFALSDTPLVSQQVSLSHEDIARAKVILQQNDPRYLPRDTQRVIDVSAQDLNLAANYLLQKTLRGHTRLTLGPGVLEARMSVRVPRLPWRAYLNIDGTIESADGDPRIAGLRIGRLAIPPTVAAWVARLALNSIYDKAQIDSAAHLLKSLRLSPDRLRLTYRWSPALIEQARDTLLTGTDREALRVYHDYLLALQARNIGLSGSLIELLGPLFEKAQARSREYDPVDEHVALLTVLGTWASRQDLAQLVPGTDGTPKTFRLKLQGRTDFAQHFLTSAALAARGDTTLSDAVGLFKEISDTDHGSGFSFTDIAADRAGTRFGELATRSPQHARTLQQRLVAGITETDIMPPAKDLPEHMHSQEFSARFGQVGSPAYQRLMTDIEQRIDACSLYKE